MKSTKNNNWRGVSVLRGTLALLILILATQLIRFAVASGHAQAAEQSAQAATVGTGEEVSAQLQLAYQQVLRSIDAFPKNAEFQERAGRIALMHSKWSTASTYPCAEGKPAADALRHFSLASKRRPSWPYAHLGVVQVKAWCNDWDESFEQALAATLNNGPTEIRIDLALANLWFERHQHAAPDSLQTAGINSAVRLANREGAVWIDRAELSGLAKAVCENVQATAAVSHCEALGWRKKGEGND